MFLRLQSPLLWITVPFVMDYSLAALKLLCEHLQKATETANSNAMNLSGILFQRAWLQGVLVSAPSDSHFLLDDGTGVIRLSISGDFLEWKIGMYVMVVGMYSVRPGELPIIKVHKMVNLSEFPDREAMWYLEVVEAFQRFYQPLIGEGTSSS